ncbi:Transforming growth factor beta regulator 1 [Dufourea novaeangliae]|uniref:Transforming growth factor beta regulator 1 n=1 Tax=Dufourea novaeangliae TaxID=178035 RepID=A0A154P8F2_DUFNO|nr:Transforming growth factor beta regulator 1 [Dufourea novaeangliae]
MTHAYDNYYNEFQKNAELQQNLKYQKKYRRLKRIIKDTVFENAALCDQVAQMQENLMLVKEERLYLLRKLCQQQGDIDPSTMIARCQSNSINSIPFNPECSTPKKTAKKRVSTDGTETKNKAKRYNKTMRRVVQLIPLDVHGRPIFPISLGDLTVYSLGEVVSDRIAYHTEDLIYPVGYCSTRVYANLRDVKTKSLYTSISPVLRSITPKGADFFGISHPTIQNLIQSTPGTRKLAMYKQQRFEVSKSQSMERGMSPIMDEEADPGLGFTALHRHYALTNSYRIKEEPSDHDLLTLQELLA